MSTSFKDLGVLIAHIEEKKSQVAYGDIREILSIISEAMVEDPYIIGMLLKNGQRRLEEKKDECECECNQK